MSLLPNEVHHSNADITFEVADSIGLELRLNTARDPGGRA